MNEAPVSEELFEDTDPAGDDAAVYTVLAVDDQDRESAPRPVEIFPVDLALRINPDAAGDERALVGRYFDRYEVSAANLAETGGWEVASVSIRRDHATSNDASEESRPVGETVEAGEEAVWRLPFPAVATLSGGHAFRVEVEQESPDGIASAVYLAERSFDEYRFPDTQISVSTPAVPLAGGENDFRARIHNRGYADIEVVLVRDFGSAPGDLELTVLDRFGESVGGGVFDTAISGLEFTSDGRGLLRIPPGESREVTFHDILVPEALGEHGQATIRVEAPVLTNGGGTALERVSGPISGSMDTNLTETHYFGELQVDGDAFADDASVPLSGSAVDRETGAPLPDTPLRIGFAARGYTWFEEIETDQDGNFDFSYDPFPGFSGTISFWAAHPDVVDVLNQAEVTIHRIYATPSQGRVRMSKNDTMDFDIRVRNPGDVPLEGLVLDSFRAWVVEEDPQTGEFVETEIDSVTGTVLSAPETLGASSRERVTLQLESALDAPDFAMAEFAFRTAEGATTRFEAELNLLPAIPILSVARPSAGYVDMSIDRGVQRSREVVIENNGLRALEGVRLRAPQEIDWMHVSLPLDEEGWAADLPDLEVGDSFSFQVVYIPSEEVDLGFYDDTILVTGENAVADFEVNLFAQVTSDLEGDVLFQVENIVDQPVPNASIRLRSTTNNIERGPYRTDADGAFLVEGLQEGEWSWQVTASGHAGQAGTVEVLPDQSVLVDPVLDRSLVTVRFQVVPVPFTDRYDIVLEQTFETRVPAPVLVMTPPMHRFENVEPGFETTVTYELRNEGLIKISDIDIGGHRSGLIQLTPLIDYIPELLPEQSVEIPARLRLAEDFEPEAEPVELASGNGDPRAAPLAALPGSGTCGAQGTADFVQGVQAIADLAAKGEYISQRTGASGGAGASALAAASAASVVGGKGTALAVAASMVGELIGCATQSFFGGDPGSPGRGSSRPGDRPPRPFRSGGDGCFPAGTEVLMADGSLKPIEKVAEGDEVVTGAGETLPFAPVSYVYERTSDNLRRVELAAVGNSERTRELLVTGEHRLWVDGEGWRFVDDIAVGDWLTDRERALWKVASNERISGTHTVYNFQIAGERAFFADGILAEDLCGGLFIDLTDNEEVSEK